MKNSIQKELVLNIVNTSFSHPTADEVYKEARKKLSNISLGTVYRNLNNLVDEGKVTRINSKDGTYRYDNSFKKHAHFVCNICGLLNDVEFDIPKNLKQLNENKILDYEMTFDGICKECLKKGGI